MPGYMSVRAHTWRASGRKQLHVGTYANGEQIENDDESKEDRDPDGIVDALARLPAEESLAVVVVELDRVGDGDELRGSEDGVGEPKGQGLTVRGDTYINRYLLPRKVHVLLYSVYR